MVLPAYFLSIRQRPDDSAPKVYLYLFVRGLMMVLPAFILSIRQRPDDGAPRVHLIYPSEA
jgi:hypothetical protein